MQEYGLVLPESCRHNLHDILRADEARLCITDLSPPLQSAFIKPAIHQGEILTAVVVSRYSKRTGSPSFRIVRYFSAGSGLPPYSRTGGWSYSSRGRRPAVAPARPVRRPCRPGCQPVWDINGVWSRYSLRLWTNRREGVVVVAAQDARQTPEGIGSDSQLRTMTFSLVERQVVFITHARHDERTLRSERNAAPRSSRPARPRLVSLWRMLCGREVLRPAVHQARAVVGSKVSL